MNYMEQFDTITQAAMLFVFAFAVGVAVTSFLFCGQKPIGG